MGHIVAIGGGEISQFETLEIDKSIVEITGKVRPTALFIPTASGEPSEYCQTFEEVYGKRLGCKTDVLFLTTKAVNHDEIEDKIFSADLVYVGGGDTRMMMNVWKEKGIDKLLSERYKKGLVLSGLSAGAICWFKYGFSDSERFSNSDQWKYIVVEGLNLVDGIFCPHLNEENRRPEFKKFMMDFSDTGFGIENKCAMEIEDDEFRIISAGGNAFLFKDQKIEPLNAGETYKFKSVVL
ncbi:peptidase E [Athalassotoga sp.]|uniref:peptidase E n=1 Tax=Athalassotoga sp. TaxID=2022597 RepID=UPI003CFD6D2E